MARGINKEIEETKEQLNARNHPHIRPTSPVERNPFHDSVNQSIMPGAVLRDASRRSGRDATNGRIHLPDVTGLTNAVASPAKPGADYHPYKGDNKPRDTEGMKKKFSSIYTCYIISHDFIQQRASYKP